MLRITQILACFSCCCAALVAAVPLQNQARPAITSFESSMRFQQHRAHSHVMRLLQKLSCVLQPVLQVPAAGEKVLCDRCFNRVQKFQFVCKLQSFKLAAPQTKRGVVLLSEHTLNKGAAHLTRYCVYADMNPLRIPMQACHQPPRHRNCRRRGPAADCLSPGRTRLHSKG